LFVCLFVFFFVSCEMDFNNNNSFNHNMNPYFTPTSYDSDNSNPVMYNMDQPYMPSWDYPTHLTHILNHMTLIFKMTSTLHRVHEDSPPPSQIFNHLVHNFYNIHSPILLHILLFLFHQLKKNLIWKGVWKPCLSPNNKFKICSIHNPSQIKLHILLF